MAAAPRERGADQGQGKQCEGAGIQAGSPGTQRVVGKAAAQPQQQGQVEKRQRQIEGRSELQLDAGDCRQDHRGMATDFTGGWCHQDGIKGCIIPPEGK